MYRSLQQAAGGECFVAVGECGLWNPENDVPCSCSHVLVHNRASKQRLIAPFEPWWKRADLTPSLCLSLLKILILFPTFLRHQPLVLIITVTVDISNIISCCTSYMHCTSLILFVFIGEGNCTWRGILTERATLCSCPEKVIYWLYSSSATYFHFSWNISTFSIC